MSEFTLHGVVTGRMRPDGSVDHEEWVRGHSHRLPKMPGRRKLWLWFLGKPSRIESGSWVRVR